MAEKENSKSYEDLIIGCFEWRGNNDKKKYTPYGIS